MFNTLEDKTRWGPKRPVIWMVGFVLACGARPAGPCMAQGRGPSKVEVATVQQREIAPTIRLVGTIRPRLRSKVAAEVSGLVAVMPVDEGDRVAKGQVLCRLRDEPRRLAHAVAVAREAELKAVLAERTAELAKAKFEAGRTDRLWEQQRGTEKEYQDAKADHEAAKGRLDQARHAVAAQKAAVLGLADNLERTQIRAPCDGIVVAKRTEIGSWVDVGGEIVELVDLSTVRVRVPVPESMIAFCQVGEAVRVSVEALGEDYPAKVSRVIPDANERARTFPVEIDLPNPTGQLKAGMFVRAAVPSGPKAVQLVVPKDAVVVRGPMSMIYVVRTSEEGQMAMPVPVEIVSEVVDQVAVQAEGLAGGDQVVVRGNEYMFGPSPVIATPRSEGAAATAAAGGE